MLVTAAGTVTTGSAASNLNLCATSGTACVNTNGVPTVVNSGGSADTGTTTAGTQGQGVGDSTNSLTVTCAVPFSCTSAMYLTSGTLSTGLYTLNNSTNPPTLTSVGSASSVLVNAIGYNANDGFIYGIAGGTFNSNKYLYKIDSNGVFYNLGILPALYASGNIVAGDFADDGYYYVKQGNSDKLFKIDVSMLVGVTEITMSAAVNSADFVYSNGKFWTLDLLTNKFVSFTTAGVVTYIGAVHTSTASIYGAMFADSNGNIFGMVGNPDDGDLVHFNTTTGAATVISETATTTNIDGASCKTKAITFATDISVSKDDGKTQYAPGTTNTYTIKVTNNGPFGAPSVNFTDTLPIGITAANIVSITTENGATTSLSTGATTGSTINDVINLPSPVDTNNDGVFDLYSSITYTISIVVPLTYTSDVINVAEISIPVGSFSDTNSSNNKDSDEDTIGVCYNPPTDLTSVVPTKHGITLQKRAGGHETGDVSSSTDWPMVRRSAHTVLESNTKGFVITRMASPETAVTTAVEGMIVYDTDDQCLKIYDGMNWSCFKTQACP